MASTIQYLRNKKQSSVILKLEGNTADTTTIPQAGTELPADGTATLRRAMWTTAGGDITLTWLGATPAVAARFSGNGNWNLVQNPPVIANNAIDPTGDVEVTKAGVSSYSIILEFGTGAVKETAPA